MKMNLTQSVVDKASNQSKPYEIRDTKLTGFLIRIQPSGRKTYYCEYRRGARVKIGTHDRYNLKLARVQARKVITSYLQGDDPAARLRQARKIRTYKDFLEERYFKWVDINHKSARGTKRRLLVDCAYFLNKRLTDITPQEVEKWRLAKVVKGNSPHTANRCFAYLRASLTKAEEWGFIKEHPLRKMKPIRTTKNFKVRYLSEAEEDRLRKALDHREVVKRETRLSGNQWRKIRNKPLFPDLTDEMYVDHLKPMVLLSMNTGVRKGELLSLKWHHVDFDLRQITIEGANAKSRKTRHIPLNKEAMSVLTKWKQQSAGSTNYVFAHKNGKPFADPKKAWKLLLERAEINNFRWHDLRHHFASRLAMAGVDLNTIRELLGHSSYEMTLRYAHLSAGHKAEAVSLLD
ncbi:MAG: hypothetical protein COA85_06880 [Robiginitomaculum sp.]|nr:MAG: hypothetical protein COA85_06880 [Robiginitomaculum sp.]